MSEQDERRAVAVWVESEGPRPSDEILKASLQRGEWPERAERRREQVNEMQARRRRWNERHPEREWPMPSPRSSCPCQPCRQREAVLAWAFDQYDRKPPDAWIRFLLWTFAQDAALRSRPA
jgi:hypothetical protein